MTSELIVYPGPTIIFAGAVWTLRPAIQILSTPISFNFHSLDRHNHVTAVRHMAAFRTAARNLKRYYDELPSDAELVSKLSHPTIFPYRTDFTCLDNNTTIHFTYREHLHEDNVKSKRLIFFGTLNEGDAEVPICIKFVQAYSQDAHMHCADAGVAPKLRGFEQLPGGWYMAVMDRLVGYDVLADLPIELIPQSVFVGIGNQLKTLHAQKLVHGDIRDTNILLKSTDRTKFMIIDFDWAGKEDIVRYPAFVNYTQIQRPDDARDGLPIKASHDDDMLGFLMARKSKK
jgi:serine/threonine protein kinase